MSAPQQRLQGDAHGRVIALDLLRAVAVLGVILFHYAFRGAAADGFTAVSLPGIVDFAKYGYLGVQLFFVISGFVIAYSAEGRSATAFAIARAARIYPAFVFCMTLTCAVTLAFGAPRFETSFAHWAANLLIVAPGLKQPFMDGAYWSIVYEITFYAWVALLMALGLFCRQIDLIVLFWLAVSVWNEATLGSSVLGRLLITGNSGFFAAGLLLYEIYAGRRDATVLLLLAAAAEVSVYQSVSGVQWLRDHYNVPFDGRVVAAVSAGSIAAVGLAMRIRRLPLRPDVILAIGGLTYPLYLLHQHIGFMVFNRLDGAMPRPALVAATIAGMTGLSWLVWRHVDRPGQRLLKAALTHAAGRAAPLWTKLFGPALKGTPD